MSQCLELMFKLFCCFRYGSFFFANIVEECQIFDFKVKKDAPKHIMRMRVKRES